MLETHPYIVTHFLLLLMKGLGLKFIPVIGVLMKLTSSKQVHSQRKPSGAGGEMQK